MENQEQQNVEEVKKPKGIKRTITGIIVIIAIALATLYAIHEMHYQSTDDAYVETTTVNVAPRVSGQIVQV